jgi:hypothetical protein
MSGGSDTRDLDRGLQPDFRTKLALSEFTPIYVARPPESQQRIAACKTEPASLDVPTSKVWWRSYAPCATVQWNRPDGSAKRATSG